ncbi:MAG: TRAP transporter small permease [Treponemataceae bacterium]
MSERNGTRAALFKLLNNFEIYLAAFMMLLMTALLFTQVVTRYLFGYAVVWTEELSIIMFVWVVYLGISSSTKEGGHLRIDILPNALPPKGKKIVLLITDLVVVVFCVAIIPFLIKIMNSQGNATSVMLKIPTKVAYASIPIGMALTAIRGIQSFIVTVMAKPEQLKTEAPTDPGLKKSE